jgi:CheY-like chemotaxis protein
MSTQNTILVIDDDALLLRSLADTLTKAGYAVLTASTGNEGLNLALSKKPNLIVLDYQMADMDGLELLKQLRTDEWGSKVEVIFATNTYDMAVINTALGYGVHDYVLKADISLDQITDLVKAYIPPTT